MNDKALEPAVSRLTPRRRPGGLTPAPRVGQCLVVLLDVSGSMADRIEDGRTKLQVAFAAFKEQLRDRLQGWHLGILLFGTLEADGIQWLLPPAGSAALDTLPQPQAAGSTPLLPALKAAWDYISRRVEQARLVVLTDGLPNSGGGPEQVLDWAREHSGVPVDCIGVPGRGLGSYDGRFLQELSRLTGGLFREVASAAEIFNAALMLSPQQRPVLGSPGRKQPSGQ